MVSLIVEWIAMTVPGLACRRQFTDHLTHLRIVENGDLNDVGGGNVGDAVGQAAPLSASGVIASVRMS